MKQHISRALAGLVLLVTAATAVFATGRPRAISADQFGQAYLQYGGTPTEPSGILLWTEPRQIDGFGKGDVRMFVNEPTAGSSGGPFTGIVLIVKNVTRNGNSEGLYAEISNGIAVSNGFTINYSATLTITGGTGRYEGATGSINPTAIEFGICALGAPFPPGAAPLSSEVFLDGHYTTQ